MSVLYLVSIIGFWGGSVYVPTSVTQIAMREGATTPDAARLASYGSMLLAVGTIVGCILAPIVAERWGRRAAMGVYFALTALTIAGGFGYAFYMVLEDLGDKMILVMRNHGMLVTGHSIGQAFALTLAFVKACEIQLALEASGAEIIDVAPDVCESTARQFAHHDAGRGQADWPAWIRRMDRLDPSYRD